MHLIGQNKQSKFTHNTLRNIPITMTCAELCCQTSWGHIPQLFAKFGTERRHLRRVKSAKYSQKPSFRACIWLAGANSQKWVQYSPHFPFENDLCGAILPDYLGTFSSALCQIWALEEAIGYSVYDISLFLKWGISNVPFCSILNIYHFIFILLWHNGCYIFR